MLYKPAGCTPTCWRSPASVAPASLQRRDMLSMPPGDTDPMLDGVSDTEPDLEVEPHELVVARARLAGVVAIQGGAPAPGASRVGEAAAAGKLHAHLSAAAGTPAIGVWILPAVHIAA